tara:strand:- start:183 stop:404 length:222 start_codon:yes stop_codon:yes gene_type:complete
MVIMKKYDYIFDGETITVKGKGLKEAVREYKQQNPKKLRATVEWISKDGTEQKKRIKLREVNIGIDRHGNIIR